MSAAKPELVSRFFERFSAGDVAAALALATDDLTLDWRNSNAPWGGGIATGSAQVHDAHRLFTASWEEVGGLRWEVVRIRPAPGGRRVVETRISGRGPSTGLPMEALGGWLVSAREGRISEAVMYQSFDEALLAGRRRTLADARLYLVCEARPGGRDPRPLLDAALRGGVDLVQLRDKELDDDGLVAAARGFRAAADEHGALFLLNDRPDLVAACEADGVHVGQHDAPVAEARRAGGAGALVGVSTHSPAQFDAALAAEGDPRADQISAGPVWETPSKEGRPAAGLDLIRHAAAVAPADAAWFAIGGIDARRVGEVVAAGGRRIVVVRAIRDAADPEAAARELRAALP